MFRTNEHDFFNPPRWKRYWRNWQTFWQIFHAYRRIEDIEQLIEWAEKKNLGVQYWYKQLLYDEDARLFKNAVEKRSIGVAARLLYRISSILFPRPEYFPKGYAKKYNRQYLLKNY